MNIGIFSCYLYEMYKKGFFKTLDESFTYAREHGITSCEMFVSEFDYLPFEEYRDTLKRNDIDFRTLIAYLPYCADNEAVCKNTTEKMKKYIDMLSSSDAKYFMIVPDVRGVHSSDDKKRVLSYITDSAITLCEYAKGSSITTIMENFSMHDFPYSTIDEMLYLAENVHGLKLAIDSGNFYCVRNDVLKAYDVLKDYIVDVHMKDWHEDPFGSIVRPMLPVLDGCSIGSGLMPLKELIQKLKQDSYDGHLVIEINSSKTKFEDYYNSVEFLRREIDA